MTGVSFIIPARNESGFIAAAIENIRAFAPPGVRWELIIVDNGSTDGTAEIARGYSEVRVLQAHGTVGAARNIGAASARQDILVFLDADVRLTAHWQSRIEGVLSELLASPQLVTGSTVGIPSAPSIIERHWFYPATRTPRRYINSGHLIISRTFFSDLGGFDAQLVTGEDFELCGRACVNGGKVRDDRELEVVHLGFPKTLTQFARRELWHGQGDGGTLTRVLNSKVALLSLLTLVLTICGPLVSIALHSWLPMITCWSAGLVSAMMLSARRTAGRSVGGWAVNTGLYYVYLHCRGIALFWRRSDWSRGS